MNTQGSAQHSKSPIMEYSPGREGVAGEQADGPALWQLLQSLSFCIG